MGFHYLYLAFFFRNLLAYIYIPVLQKELDILGGLAIIMRACKQENDVDYVLTRKVYQPLACVQPRTQATQSLFLIQASAILGLAPGNRNAFWSMAHLGWKLFFFLIIIIFYFLFFIFCYGTHRPYSFILLFLFFTMALIGHTHLVPLFLILFSLLCEWENNKKK